RSSRLGRRSPDATGMTSDLTNTVEGEMIGRLLSQASKSTWLLSTSLIAAAIAMWSGVPTSAFAAQDCAALANLKINNTNLLSAVEVPADGDLPAYCRVLGYVRRALIF